MSPLRQRERILSERFPNIRWTTPIPTTVGDITTLTCRLCTALDGLKGADVISGRVGFASEAEHAEHLSQVHMESDEPAIPYSPGAAEDWPSGVPRPRVVLVKTSAVFGAAPLGEQYEVIGKPGLDREELILRAYGLLKRARPDENSMEWTVSG